MARGRYEKRLKSPLGHQHKNALKCVNTVTFNYPRAKRELQLFSNSYTVFENHRKSLFQHCERSELRLHFEWTKVREKCQKWSNFDEFLKT